ncbi:MAG: hypothetical protein Q8J74_11695 [Candidatus Didemnitutus sp.]|nr:hypothetical protein [Candidatus Didemnitutus sp.]
MSFGAIEFRTRLLPIVLAQAIGLACGVVGVVLASHWVAPQDYGHYAIFLTLTPLGMWVVHAGLIKFVGRHWAAAPDRAQLLREVARSALRKTPWLIAATVGATLLVAPPNPLLFGACLLVAAAGLSIAQLAQSAQQADRRHWTDCGLAATGSLARTFLPLLCYAAFSATPLALQAGFALHALIAAGVGAGLLGRHWRRSTPASSRVLTPVFDGPLFIVLAVTAWVLSGFNRWIVAWFFGTEATGYFTLAVNIGAILPSVLGSMMLQYLQPGWFAPHDDSPGERHRLGRETDRAAGFYAAGALALTALLHLLMPVLIGNLVSERYAAVAGLVLPAGCFTVAVTTGFFFHSLLLAVRRERACGPADLTGAVILIAGGAVGAGLGEEWFLRWLIISPAVPWVVNRTLARRALFNSA